MTGIRNDVARNNAAVMACPLDYTKDGLEMQIGTNHFGHYLMTVPLAAALEAGAKASGKTSRLVSLSSIGHRRSGIRWDDPHFRNGPYDKWESYGQAKTANALFAVGFHKRFKDRGITANAVMPGGIMTPLQRHLPLEEQKAMGWIDDNGKVRDGFKTTEQGASTSVWAAVGSELEGIGGLYLEDCAQAGPWTEAMPWAGVLPHALDPESADRLWALEQSLKSDSFGALLAWLDEPTRPEHIRRFQLAARHAKGPVFLFRPLAVQAQASAAPLRLALLPRQYPGLAVQLLKRRGPVQADPILVNLPLPSRALRPLQEHPSQAPALAPVRPSLSTAQIQGLGHALDRLSVPSLRQ
jgi:NAD(P)-dependent dehydrogenase (short-subunit alcohol dehydrogenase family)